MSWAYGLPQSHLCISWRRNDSWRLGRIWVGLWNLPAGTPCPSDTSQIVPSLGSPETQKDQPDQKGDEKQKQSTKNCCLTRTALYSSSWLLLSGMLWRRHSLMMHCEISSQISSPTMDESFLSPIDTSEEQKKNADVKSSLWASTVRSLKRCATSWFFHTVPRRCACSVLSTRSSLL